MNDKFLTLSALRDMFDVSRATVHRWTERGLRTVRVGNVVRVRESDLQAFIQKHEVMRTETSAPDELP